MCQHSAKRRLQIGTRCGKRVHDYAAGSTTLQESLRGLEKQLLDALPRQEAYLLCHHLAGKLRELPEGTVAPSQQRAARRAVHAVEAVRTAYPEVAPAELQAAAARCAAGLGAPHQFELLANSHSQEKESF